MFLILSLFHNLPHGFLEESHSPGTSLAVSCRRIDRVSCTYGSDPRLGCILRRGLGKKRDEASRRKERLIGNRPTLLLADDGLKAAVYTVVR